MKCKKIEKMIKESKSKICDKVLEGELCTKLDKITIYIKWSAVEGVSIGFTNYEDPSYIIVYSLNEYIEENTDETYNRIKRSARRWDVEVEDGPDIVDEFVIGKETKMFVENCINDSCFKGCWFTNDNNNILSIEKDYEDHPSGGYDYRIEIDVCRGMYRTIKNESEATFSNWVPVPHLRED